MRSLYESILDTDKESAEKTGNVLFFPDFAECFVKVFGKVDRTYINLDRRAGAPQVVGSIKINNWKWKDANDNEFVNRLREMIDMLEKKYPKMRWNINHNLVLTSQSVWKARYTIHFKLQKYEFDWCINVIEEQNKIRLIHIFSLHTQALKNKELLKIIDDNI